MRFEHNDEFESFKHSLRDALNGLTARTIDDPRLKPSAVMILLQNRDGVPTVLLTRRTDKVKTHKGEVSLPGGGREESDESLLATALRETREEMGIDPDDVEYIGRFDDFFSIYGFHVSTFTGSIPYPYSYTVNTDEIDDYIEVPLQLFAEKKYTRIETFHYEGKPIDVYYYHYGGFEIWGLTARILTAFCERIFPVAGDTVEQAP